MKLEWMLTETQPHCDEVKPPEWTSEIVCELPWDHIVLQNGEPARMTSHMGRSKSGAWYSWD
jgi:hypothetical protein